MELPVNKNILNIAIFFSIALILITLIRLNHPFFNSFSSISTYKNSALIGDTGEAITTGGVENGEKCDIFTGEWVPDPGAPYYTNRTCWAIHEHQNCMKYGRPDSGFMKWRWKPDGCDLPVFNPFQFLDMVRGKSMAFVGDSVGRNQMQSMICLLSRVEYPVDDSPTTDEMFKRWRYVNYNFTLAYFTSPFLVKSEQRDSEGPTRTGLFNLYLDEPDSAWSNHIDEFDFLIINAGHWFTRPAVYFHRHRRLAGCHFCQLPNVTELPMTHGYRRAFRTAFAAINARRRYGGVTFLRTFAPSHFEGGQWNAGGNCLRRRPWRSNEAILEGMNLEFYVAEMEEFRVAERAGKRWRVMDTTQALLLRPDGHPSRYGHWPAENVTLYNDCVHWCLPGPVDSWADMLQHMIKMEARRNYRERVSQLQMQKKMQ